MTTTESSRRNAASIDSQRLRLLLIMTTELESLLNDERAAAEATLGCRIPSYFPAAHDRHLFELRLGQIAEDPSIEEWLLRAVVRKTDGRMIGHVGFHGPPDDDGVLEVGYELFSDYQKHGYAIEAVEALMAWAADHHGIERFRASIAPDNKPSLKLARKLGFVHVGRHWDEEDGEELVFAVDRVQQEKEPWRPAPSAKR
ncbi:MAG: GNAT family N-acetyltransferase [Actinomycetota bacterium]